MPFDPVSYAMGAKSAGGGGGGSSTLAGLTDVDISNPTNGQTLVYNATSGKWENGAGGGGVTIVEIEYNGTTTTAKMKAGAMYAAAQTSVLVLKDVNDSYYVVVQFYLDNGIYVFSCDSSADISLAATSADDYPTITDD